ncbi:MAG: methyltransferase domain-containing protein [Bacteroidetes bacterium]|nr:methyltransferase domain-containing protein [Bacteroidota bacterium]
MLNLFRIPVLRVLGRKMYHKVVKYREVYISHLLSPDKIVLGGIFKGMKYPVFESFGSGLLTKLLGSYEDELHPALQKFSKNQYSDIIDIGCAEGYYAVGSALLFPQAKVHAYDIEESAISLCRKMATVNETINRTLLKRKCDRATLLNFQFEGRGLVICDCEGYEKELFDKEVAKSLKSCDVIIELHEGLASGIKGQIEQAFNETHDIEFVKSKLKSVRDYSLLSKLPVEYQQDQYLIERDTAQEWAVISSRVY